MVLPYTVETIETRGIYTRNSSDRKLVLGMRLSPPRAQCKAGLRQLAGQSPPPPLPEKKPQKTEKKPKKLRVIKLDMSSLPTPPIVLGPLTALFEVRIHLSEHAQYLQVTSEMTPLSRYKSEKLSRFKRLQNIDNTMLRYQLVQVPHKKFTITFTSLLV